MRGAKARLVGAAAVSQVGNWLTFTGLLQYVQTTYGSSATISTFIVQAVPPLVLARWVTARMAGVGTRSAWLVVQLVLCLLSLALLFRDWGLVSVLSVLGVTSLFRTISSTLFMAVATEWTPAEQRGAVFTAIGSANSITLAISPAFGGALGEAFGYSALFVADAATFVLAALVMVRRRPGTVDGRVVSSGSSQWVGRPRGVATRSVPGLRLWMWFGVAGAAVNAVELPVFTEVHRFGVSAFGIALTCYGVGGLVAFLLSLVRRSLPLRLDVVAAAYTAALAFWVYGGHVGAFVGFAFAGLAYGLYSGQIRVLVAEAATGEVSATDMWAWANQTIQVVNLLVYAFAAALFAAGAPVLVCAALTVASALVLTVLSYTARIVPPTPSKHSAGQAP